MCGRYAASREAGEIAELADPELGEHPEAAPTMALPIVLTRLVDGAPRRERRLARWGLVPSWARDDRGTPLINARAETAASKPAFASALAARRCLVPADAYFEWTPEPAGGARKRKWRIWRPDGAPLTFAGLYDLRRGPTGWLLSYTILTKAAEPGLAHLHDRMPVLVDPAEHARWLDPRLVDPAAVADLLDPAPAGLVAEPVGPWPPVTSEPADATLF